MKTRIRRRLAAGKQRIEKRLDKANCEGCERPMLRPANIRYALAERTRGMTYGGIGSMLLLVRKLELAEAIDRRLHLLKIHLPYHESDHVLNFAFNALCDATCLEDLELRRNDEVYLDAVNARRIPDPTTAGDFCRRFRPHDVRTLLDVFNDTRLKVWAGQPDAFFDEARIDMDGTLVRNTGECKQGVDSSYQGDWSYHPLILTAEKDEKKLDQAIEKSKRAVEQDPKNWRALGTWGKALEATGNRKEAMEKYKQAQTINPRSTSVQKLVRDLEVKMGK